MNLQALSYQRLGCSASRLFHDMQALTRSSKNPRNIMVQYEGDEKNLTAALIQAITRGVPLELHPTLPGQYKKPLSLVIGMIDCHNEPWALSNVYFFAYQFQGDQQNESELKACWLGEVITPHQVLLRELSLEYVPATTTWFLPRTYFRTEMSEIKFTEPWYNKQSVWSAVTTAAQKARFLRANVAEYDKYTDPSPSAAHPYPLAFLPGIFERIFPWTTTYALEDVSNQKLRYAGIALVGDKPGYHESRKYYASYIGVGWVSDPTSSSSTFMIVDKPMVVEQYPDETFGGLLNSPLVLAE